MSPRLWWWASAGHRLGLARAALGVTAVLALAVAGLGLLQGLGEVLQRELASVGGELRVRAPSLSIGGLDLTGSVVAGRTLDEGALEGLRSIEGVDQAQPEAWARVPLTFYGGFAGQQVQSEGALLGVVGDAVDHPRGWDWKPGEPVPVLAPRSLLAVYNGSFAPTNGLPRLTDDALTGLDFTILAGRSPYGKDRGSPSRLDAEVVGTTGYGGALAAIVPLEVVRWIEQQSGLEDPGRISAVRLTLKGGADPLEVERQVRAQGWAVDRGDGALQKLGALLKSVRLGLGTTALVLALAALFGVAQIQSALLRARAEEMDVLRALGLSRASVAAGLLMEVLLSVGLASGMGAVGGALLAAGLARRASELVSEWIGLSVRLSAGVPLEVWIVALMGPALAAALLAAPAILEVSRGGRGTGRS